MPEMRLAILDSDSGFVRVLEKRAGDLGWQHRRLVAGELEIRADQFQAFVSSASVDLTRREFEVLQLLAQAKGKVLQREEIYQAVWGYAMAHGDRSVDVFIRKVRQKLERASPDWSYIHTHFGVGYRFDPEPRQGPVPEAAVEDASPERAAAEGGHDAAGSGPAGLPGPQGIGDESDSTLLTG